MTGRALAVQGGIAVLGLVTVYATWQREPERAPGAVEVIDASKSDVTLIHYEDDATSVNLTPGKIGDDDGVWLHVVTKPKPEAKPDPAKPDHAKPDQKTSEKQTPPPPPRDLPGADNAKHLYEQFAPLVSPRAFGVLDAAKLKELGLDKPTRTVDVTVKGAVRHYEIGQPSNQPGGESFLRDTRDGRVYLMPRTVLSDLQNSQHLVDRRLHTFELTEWDHFKVSSGGKEKEFVSVGRESPKTIGIAAAKTPDKKDQTAKNWHDALWRLFPTELLGKGEDPANGKVNVSLRVEYSERGKKIGWVEIGHVETASGSPDDTSNLYARSEHTAGWVKIPSGGQLIPDAQKLIAAP
jgi:hypothetical protein